MATWNGTASSTNNNPPTTLSTIEEHDDQMLTSACSTVPSSNASSRPEEDHLTINKKWKIETELEKRTIAKSVPSVFIPMIKVLVTIIFAGLVLVSALTSKYSILKVAQKLIQKEEKNKTVRIENTSRFIVIFFMVLCPYLFNFLRAVWVGGLRKDMPWPSKSKLLWEVISSIMESCGLCLFAYKIFSYYSLAISQLLLYTVYILPPFLSLWQCYQERRTIHTIQWLQYIISAISAISGTVCIIKLAVDESNGNMKYIWHAIIAIITLTVAWSHQLREIFTNSRSSNVNQSNLQDNGYSSSGFVSQEYSIEADEQRTEYQIPITSSEISPFWKLGIISNLFTICFICIFSFLLYFVDSECYASETYFTRKMYDEFLAAWDLLWNEDTQALVINLTTSLFGYFLACIACHVCMRRGAFTIPLLASLIITPIILLVATSCENLFGISNKKCTDVYGNMPLLVASTGLMIISIILQSLGLFKSETTLLEKESKLFWRPTFNGVILDQCLLLNKKNTIIDNEVVRKSSNKIRVYICTTMYRETSEEMKEVLESIHRVNLSQMEGSTFFESHIIFDSGIKNRSPSRFAYQLIVLLQPILGIKPEDGTKVLTPYGMKLSWRLPSERRNQYMNFNIHLKDNLKVKNKKRWSQIMYMSYVLDFLAKDVETEENCFILTTDADVKFTPDSVEALLDLMIRDTSVGAVCARTHPVGSGPLVWYQVFDYAIGHWFQKAAEHVLGSVLCAPGCFSVYRCKSLRDILPQYATSVEHADDFLIKDMGEDRWMCTLLVQCGWRIEYCAAAENSTTCPMEFEEFFKQRRRWIASTLANLMLILRKWRLITMFNHRVSLLFILYQGILLVSTLIGPSTVILLVSGGLSYGLGINTWVSVLIQLTTCIIFVITCLKAPSKVQIQSAKFLTFVYAVVMCAVAVGTVEQIVQDLNGNEYISGSMFDLPASITTLYFAGLASLFMVTAVAHPTEFLCLFHGIWYLLCLPAGYVVLNLYSICNLTDRSWGTREEKVISVKSHEPWYIRCFRAWKMIRPCCDKTKSDVIKDYTKNIDVVLQDDVQQSVDIVVANRDSTIEIEETEDIQESKDDVKEFPIPVDEWLPQDLKSEYLHMFKEHGFDNTLFIAGMTIKDLQGMGINKSLIQYICGQIKLLPTFEIEYDVPPSVNQWLEDIGLDMYQSHFKRCKIKKPTDMQVLKSYCKKEIVEELGINKEGHIKRLLYAISKLRNPTYVERKVNEVKELIEESPIHHLRELNIGEHAFWRSLIDQCLTPGGEAFSIEVELKDELNNLRSYWLMVLAVSNTLWLILISTLATKDDLTLLGANPLNLAFLVVFSFMFIIQFICMWIHRFQTLIHFLARAPYRCGRRYLPYWTFRDTVFGNSEIHDSVEVQAINSVRDADKRCKIKQQQRRIQAKRQAKEFPGEKSPLLPKN